MKGVFMKAGKKTGHLGMMGVLVAVCALTLCLVGCGGQAASSSAAASSASSDAAASSASAESSAASEAASAASAEAASAAASEASAEAGAIAGESDGNDDVSVPEEFALVNDISKNILENGVSDDKTIDFNALPTSKDNELSGVFKDFELGTGSDDSMRATTGTTVLSAGGIMMPIPGTWRVAKRYNEFLFENQAGTVAGHLSWAAKKSGVNYDYVAMVKEIPAILVREGGTDVVVIDYGPVKSDRGTQCGACICYAAKIKGVEFCFYSEIIGSKSWLNLVEFAGRTNDFKSEISNMQKATESIKFHTYEVV